MLSVEMLPAQRGDCLWVSYGEPGDIHHVLIDAGPREVIRTLVPELERRIGSLPGGNDRVELLVVTHIDADHVQGAVSLLSAPGRLQLFREIWFNGWRHVSETLGAPDGERLGTLLSTDRPRWNRSFGGGAVVVPTVDENVDPDVDPDALPEVHLPGGLSLTLLSPDADGLATVARAWEKECRKAGLVPGQGAVVPRTWRRSEVLGFDPDVLALTSYRRDPSPANRSSIAFIASYGPKRVLFAADAHAEVLSRSLRRVGPGPHRFDAIKVSHHGSRANLSIPFLQSVRSKRWLISTDGSTFHHPNPEALARIIVTQDRPELIFNYVSDEPHLHDVIAGAGERYKVKLPRRNSDGTYRSGLTVNL